MEMEWVAVGKNLFIALPFPFIMPHLRTLYILSCTESLTALQTLFIFLLHLHIRKIEYQASANW